MFEILEKRDSIRRGIIKTKSGVIKTPFFMPDATRGVVRSLDRKDLENSGVEAMVVNTYHLYLNPGIELIKKAGGIHKFMNFSGPLLSDSGGYQVFSLIHKNPRMGKVTEEEVIFKSPSDGSSHTISPEKAIQIQFDLGVDMMVCLDDPRPNSAPREEIASAVSRTLRWALRCKEEYFRQIKERKIPAEKRPALFGVIQGGDYLELRKVCAQGLLEIGFDGYGFGGRHLDGEGNFLGEVLEYTAGLIPENSPRFALGVGTPGDIARCHQMGWDMFDCVIPTREGRHGRLFVWKKGKKESFSPEEDFYQTININNQKYRQDFSPVDPECGCVLCRSHSRSYLRHLFVIKDPLALRLSALHNLFFFGEIIKKMRKKGGEKP